MIAKILVQLIIVVVEEVLELSNTPHSNMQLIARRKTADIFLYSVCDAAVVPNTTISSRENSDIFDVLNGLWLQVGTWPRGLDSTPEVWSS